MFPIKQPIIKNVNKSEGTKLNVSTSVTDRITDTKETNYTRQIPMTKGGKKLNVSVVRDYHKESAKRPSLDIPQFTDKI